MVHHLAVELGAESTLTINQPWTMGEDGYTSVVTGRLVDVRVNTSLEYQPLGKAATIEVQSGGADTLGHPPKFGLKNLVLKTEADNDVTYHSFASSFSRDGYLV